VALGVSRKRLLQSLDPRASRYREVFCLDACASAVSFAQLLRGLVRLVTMQASGK
jgi:hypothetical protein